MLPPRLVKLRQDRMDEKEEDFYQALYTQSQAQFNTYLQVRHPHPQRSSSLQDPTPLSLGAPAGLCAAAAAVVLTVGHGAEQLRPHLRHPHPVSEHRPPASSPLGMPRNLTCPSVLIVCVRLRQAVDHPYLVIHSNARQRRSHASLHHNTFNAAAWA